MKISASGWLDADGDCRNDCQLGWSLFTAQSAIAIKAGDEPAFFFQDSRQEIFSLLKQHFEKLGF